MRHRHVAFVWLRNCRNVRAVPPLLQGLNVGLVVLFSPVWESAKPRRSAVAMSECVGKIGRETQRQGAELTYLDLPPEKGNDDDQTD